jgi:hypothetical protein
LQAAAVEHGDTVVAAARVEFHIKLLEHLQNQQDSQLQSVQVEQVQQVAVRDQLEAIQYFQQSLQMAVVAVFRDRQKRLQMVVLAADLPITELLQRLVELRLKAIQAARQVTETTVELVKITARTLWLQVAAAARARLDKMHQTQQRLARAARVLILGHRGRLILLAA